MYGWFSAKAKNDGVKTVFWKRPDGSEVEVTDVTRTKKKHSKWPDAKCVGEVTEFACAGQEAFGKYKETWT